MEGGSSPISTVELDKLMTTYGLMDQPERERLQALNRGARSVGWWNAYRNDAPEPYLNYVSYEAGAVFIRQFPAAFVPGLLQTPEYAEALTRAAVEPEEVNTVVALRLQRQSELARRSRPPRRYFILDECVLRRQIGMINDPAVMPGQLNYIAEAALASELITVRVIPFANGAHAGQAGPFTLLEFDGGLSDLLYLDPGEGERAIMTFNDSDVAEYAVRFEKLVDFALPESESLELIRTIAEEMRNSGSS